MENTIDDVFNSKHRVLNIIVHVFYIISDTFCRKYRGFNFMHRVRNMMYEVKNMINQVPNSNS